MKWGILLLVFLVACVSEVEPVQPVVTQPVEPEVQTVSVEPNPTTQSAPEVKEFTIRAFKFGFEPNVIEVNKGDTVRITAYASDGSHGLAISEFGVNLRLPDSRPREVEFVADKAGTFTFRCSVVCGSGHGRMTGTLIVNE